MHFYMVLYLVVFISLQRLQIWLYLYIRICMRLHFNISMLSVKWNTSYWILHLFAYVFAFGCFLRHMKNWLRLYFNINLLAVKWTAKDWILYLVHTERSCIHASSTLQTPKIAQKLGNTKMLPENILLNSISQSGWDKWHLRKWSSVWKLLLVK